MRLALDAVTALLDFIDRRRIVRRAMVVTVSIMLVDAYAWGKGFALRSTLSGADQSLVIAAVLAPITALMGFVYKLYDQSRQGD